MVSVLSGAEIFFFSTVEQGRNRSRRGLGGLEEGR